MKGVNIITSMILFLSLIMIFLTGCILFRLKEIISPNLFNRTSESFDVSNGLIFGFSFILAISCLFMLFNFKDEISISYDRLKDEEKRNYEISKTFFIISGLIYLILYSIYGYFGKDLYSKHLTTTDKFFIYGSLVFGGLIAFLIFMSWVLFLSIASGKVMGSAVARGVGGMMSISRSLKTEY